MIEKMMTITGSMTRALRIGFVVASLLAIHGCAPADEASAPEPEPLQEPSSGGAGEGVSSGLHEDDKALRKDWCCALKMEGVYEDEVVIGCLNYPKRLRVVAEAQCWSAGVEDQGLSSTTLRSGNCDRYRDCFTN